MLVASVCDCVSAHTYVSVRGSVARLRDFCLCRRGCWRPCNLWGTAKGVSRHVPSLREVGFSPKSTDPGFATKSTALSSLRDQKNNESLSLSLSLSLSPVSHKYEQKAQSTMRIILSSTLERYSQNH